MSKQFGWCFVGVGSIARQVTGDDPDLRVVSVCARSHANAQRFADQHGATACNSLAQAVSQPGVDGVYIATPHSDHHACTLEALALGKPVLCEKPMAVNGRQAREMRDAAKRHGLFLSEAMWPRYNPILKAVRAMIAAGEIGPVHYVAADFASTSTYEESSRLYSLALAGGGILDLGVYPIALIQMVYGEAPEGVEVQSLLTPSGVDQRVTALLRYSGGRAATMFSALDTQSPWSAVIHGRDGYITIPEYWRARSATLTRRNGETLRIERDGCVGWAYQMHAVEELISSGVQDSPLMPLDESVLIADVMDSLRAKAGVRYSWDD